MKRVLFAALAIVLIASLAWGWSAGLMGGGVAATGGPDIWYYSGDGTYTDGTRISTSTIQRGANVTVAAAGSITRIGMYVDSTSDSTTMLCNLYSDSNVLLGTGSVSTGPWTAAWVDVTLSVPYSVSASQTVRPICGVTNGAYVFTTSDASTSDGFAGEHNPWTGTVTPFVPTSSGINNNAVRVYVD